MKKEVILSVVLCLLIAGVFGGATAAAKEIMLPQVFTEQDVAGWWMSEKLDGVRGYWDGKQLYSKGGKVLAPPVEFTAGLPPFAVEGELWAGRSRFEQTVSCVNREQPHAGWLKLKFGIFDIPQEPGTFRNRIGKAKAWIEENKPEYAFVIDQVEVINNAHLHEELKRVEKLGGEGLIVRDPDAVYENGRSLSLLKVKSFEDAEAVVIAHLPGKGRNVGRMGALLVEAEDGLQFRIGGGFSDAERELPPPVGSVITYKYYGRYQSGLPRFPSFLRTRLDNDL